MPDRPLTILQHASARRRETNERERLAALSALRSALRDILPGERVYVFGSALLPGRFGPDSDLDVALEREPRGQSMYAIASRLMEAVGRPVDVVLLGESRLSAKILQEGEAWTT